MREARWSILAGLELELGDYEVTYVEMCGMWLRFFGM
jgi:hypothetical protein